MNLYKFIAGLVLLYISHGAYADSFNIQLGDASARFMYAAEVFGGEFGPTDMEAGYYFNEDDDTIAHLSLVLRSDSLDNPFVTAIGARVYYGDVGNGLNQTPADIAVIAFGVALRYMPDNLGGVGIRGYYFGSPSVTSYLDADSFTEYGVALDLSITEQVEIYIGYRSMSVKLDTGTSLDVDDSVMYGVNFNF